MFSGYGGPLSDRHCKDWRKLSTMHRYCSVQTICGGDGCIGSGSWGCIDARPRQRSICPLEFMSRALNPTKQWSSTYERQLAAIAYCFIESWHYLEGVTTMTDHKQLTLFMDQQILSSSQTKWLRLGLFQSIHPKIGYQRGKAKIVANALSRSKIQNHDKTKDQRQ